MHKRVLVVIDMQNDFLTGPLGGEQYRAVVPEVVSLIGSGEYDFIYATMDTHGEDYLSTQEGENLPIEHCIGGTEGWKLEPSVQAALDRSGAYRTVSKSCFGSLDLCRIMGEECDPRASVDIVGICTDLCVVSNALMIRSCCPEMRVSVVSGACAGTTIENHEAALETMRSCQIGVKTHS